MNFKSLLLGYRKYILIGSLLCLSVSVTSCGSSNTSNSDVSTSTTSAYPTDLAVAQPFTTSNNASESASLLEKFFDKIFTKATAADDGGQGYDSIKEAIQSVLEATTLDGCFDFTKTLGGGAGDPITCYGPAVDYTNYPIGGGSGQLPTGDLGIWNTTNGSRNEACLAAQVNSLVGRFGDRVKKAQLFMASALCVARLSNITLPQEVGESVDLTTAIREAAATRETVFDTGNVKISRLADSSNGKAVYQLVREGTFTPPGGGGNSATISMVLKHSPQDETNSTYRGLLTFTWSGLTPGGGCDPGVSKGTAATSIAYEKSSASSLNMEIREGTFCTNSTVSGMFGADGQVDPSYSTLSHLDGWSSNFNRAFFNVDPSSGTGTYAFAWQAGSGDDATRVFNATLSSTGGSTGGPGGVGYFGYGPTVSSSGVGSITKMICNWAGPGNSHIGLSSAQRQGFLLNPSTGVFESDPTLLNMKYAPTNDCSYAGGPFTYQTTSGTMTNDNPLGSLTTPNLVALSSFTFTVPTAPTLP